MAGDNVGHFAAFEGYGSIYWYPVIGAWPVTTQMLAVWATVNYELGRLGYPIEAPRNLPDGYVRQAFQNGIAARDGNGKALIATGSN